MMSSRASRASALTISTTCCCATPSWPTRRVGRQRGLADRGEQLARCGSSIARRSTSPRRTGSWPRNTFSATVRSGSRLNSWWMMPMPAPWASRGPRNVARSPGELDSALVRARTRPRRSSSAWTCRRRSRRRRRAPRRAAHRDRHRRARGPRGRTCRRRAGRAAAPAVGPTSQEPSQIVSSRPGQPSAFAVDAGTFESAWLRVNIRLTRTKHHDVWKDTMFDSIRRPSLIARPVSRQRCHRACRMSWAEVGVLPSRHVIFRWRRANVRSRKD